jgi:sec-independent protein translocase protein TatA
MGANGPTELLIVAGVAMLLFGGGRIADLGKGFGQAIRNFKQGLRDDAPQREEQ